MQMILQNWHLLQEVPLDTRLSNFVEFSVVFRFVDLIVYFPIQSTFPVARLQASDYVRVCLVFAFSFAAIATTVVAVAARNLDKTLQGENNSMTILETIKVATLHSCQAFKPSPTSDR